MHTRIINDIPGYTSDNDLMILGKLTKLLDKKDSLIIECGTFFGRSLSTILDSRNINTKVHVVDNFRKECDFDISVSKTIQHRHWVSGSLEKFDKAMNIVQDTKDWQSGFNLLMSARENEFNIYSVNSSDYVQQGKIDLVFLDTWHSYDRVMAELNKFGADPETLLCGDDFSKLYPDVSVALNEYRHKTKKRLVVYENTKIWVLWPVAGFWTDKVNLI